MNIQEQNKMKNGVREVETKLEDFRIKYKNSEEINKLEGDLNAIKKENMTLKNQLGIWIQFITYNSIRY